MCAGGENVCWEGECALGRRMRGGKENVCGMRGWRARKNPMTEQKRESRSVLIRVFSRVRECH